MATAGERFKMPVYIVRRPAAETDGESVEMEFVLPSGCVPPPPHIHPQQVEEYEVLEVASMWWWRASGARSRPARQPRCRSGPFTRSGIAQARWSACATGTGRRCALRTSSNGPAGRFKQRASSGSAIRASCSISRWSCWISTTRSSQAEGGSGFRCRLSRGLRGCFPPRLLAPNRLLARTMRGSAAAG